MVKIVALSKYGFKIDSLKNDWEKVDKYLLAKDLFKNLKKGDEINIIGRNKEGFITEFELKPISLLDSILKPTQNMIENTRREQLKLQCLIIVCNSCFHNRDIGFDKSREDAIKFSHKLFKELEDANYYNW